MVYIWGSFANFRAHPSPKQGDKGPTQKNTFALQAPAPEKVSEKAPGLAAFVWAAQWGVVPIMVNYSDLTRPKITQIGG